MGFKDAAAKPHYLGHRERLRQRFREAGADALPDYELLELILFRALPRRDTKPLAKAILAMGRGLGLSVVAEGIETREQLEFLTQQGCDLGQGFYFSQPLPASECGDRLLRARLLHPEAEAGIRKGTPSSRAPAPNA